MIAGPGPCPKCGAAMVPLFTSFYCATCEKRASQPLTFKAIRPSVPDPLCFTHVDAGVPYLVVTHPNARPVTFKRARWWDPNDASPVQFNAITGYRWASFNDANLHPALKAHGPTSTWALTGVIRGAVYEL